MKIFLTLLLFQVISLELCAQKYVTEKSFIRFYSHATIEDIKAENIKSVGLFNQATNDLVFSVPLREFQFAKALMQEHFNEKYMESDKYPKSTFQGKIDGYEFSKSGVQNIKAIGKLAMHGQSKDVVIEGTIEKLDTRLQFKSVFIVKLVDYTIEIPTLLWENIAEQIEVTVDFTFKPQ